MKLAFLNSSINTPAANVITRVLHYTFMHVSTINYLLNAGFFCELLYNRKSFPTNNKEIMQPRNFSTANDLHYTVFADCFAIMYAANKCMQPISHKLCYHPECDGMVKHLTAL